jgi:hypothetical protein
MIVLAAVVLTDSNHIDIGICVISAEGPIAVVGIARKAEVKTVIEG